MTLWPQEQVEAALGLLESTAEAQDLFARATEAHLIAMGDAEPEPTELVAKIWREITPKT